MEQSFSEEGMRTLDTLAEAGIITELIQRDINEASSNIAIASAKIETLDRNFKSLKRFIEDAKRRKSDCAIKRRINRRQVNTSKLSKNIKGKSATGKTHMDHCGPSKLKKCSEVSRIGKVDGRSEKNSAEWMKKHHAVEKCSSTSEKDFSMCSVEITSDNNPSVKSSLSALPKGSPGNVSKDTSVVKSNTPTSAKYSANKSSRDVSSGKLNSSASSVTQCQNAPTLEMTPEKRRGSVSNSDSISSTPEGKAKGRNAIRFNFLMPPDCKLSMEDLRGILSNGNKYPHAFRRFIADKSSQHLSEVQKILAFNHGKSSLNLSERKFIMRLEKTWIDFKYPLKMGTAAADASAESILLNNHIKQQQDKTPKSFSASQNGHSLSIQKDFGVQHKQEPNEPKLPNPPDPHVQIIKSEHQQPLNLSIVHQVTDLQNSIHQSTPKCTEQENCPKEETPVEEVKLLKEDIKQEGTELSSTQGDEGKLDNTLGQASIQLGLESTSKPEAPVLDGSPNTATESIGLQRKKRTCLEPTTRLALEKKFRQHPYPTPDQISLWAKKLKMETRVLKLWFCNRRSREKRANRRISFPASGCGDSSSRLSSATPQVESHLDQPFNHDMNDLLPTIFNILHQQRLLSQDSLTTNK